MEAVKGSFPFFFLFEHGISKQFLRPFLSTTTAASRRSRCANNPACGSGKKESCWQVAHNSILFFWLR